MSNHALITFKAGRCIQNGKTLTPQPEPGYVYLYSDDLPHFCWRPRNVPGTEPTLDLTMVPGDGSFVPLLKEEGAEDLHSPTNGRVYKLQFESSSQKYYFYLQSRSQHANGDPSWWSERDQRLGQIVSQILQGEEVDVHHEMLAFGRGGPAGGSGNGPNEDLMDVDEDQGTGGAGAGATGGDTRQEGELSREGGEDGGRAAADQTDASALVQNFLQSFNQQGGQRGQQAEQSYTTLSELLAPADTIPFLEQATEAQIDNLCSNLPQELFEDDTTSDAAHYSKVSLARRRAIVARVLRSPQLQQSLGSLTIALRDGGLPMIGESLGVRVENGGLMHGSSMPLGNSAAVKAFVDGVKQTVLQHQQQSKDDDQPMDGS